MIPMGRKNWLFCWTEVGAKYVGIFQSLIVTCKMHGIEKDRALATGLFNSGATVGAVTAPVIVSAITLALGWKWAFIITGALGFIWVVLWFAYYHAPEKHPRVSRFVSSGVALSKGANWEISARLAIG